MAVTPDQRTYDEIELSSEAFWSKSIRERDEAFEVLRRERPVTWQRRAYGSLMSDVEDPGYWAVVRHEDVVAVSKAHDVFSSSPHLGGVMFENAPAELLVATQSILTMDEPEHLITRRLISSAFTPRQVRQIEDQINLQAASIVTEFLTEGPHDFVEQVSTRLPLWTISGMLGVPEELREPMVQAADDMVGYNDPEYMGDRDPFMTLFEATGALHQIAQTLMDARRSAPQEDLMTALVQAEVDGHRLSDDEIKSFFVLLAVAGNDTTRNTTSHAMKALADHPEQKQFLIENYDRAINGAIEEFVRWATPVMTFRRTAKVDAVVGGVDVDAGDKVVMFYSSANRDESVFKDPWTFDIKRNPNQHVSFGGGGPHFCLGNHVARMQLQALFRELLTRVPDLKVGEPEFVTGHFMNAIKRMPCSA